MGVALPPAPLAGSVWTLGAVLAGAGAGFGLLNVGCFELLDVVVALPRRGTLGRAGP